MTPTLIKVQTPFQDSQKVQVGTLPQEPYENTVVGTLPSVLEDAHVNGPLPESDEPIQESLAGTLETEEPTIRGPLPSGIVTVKVIDNRRRLLDILQQDLPLFFQWINAVAQLYGLQKHLIDYVENFCNAVTKQKYIIRNHQPKANISPLWQHMYWRVLHAFSFLVVGNPMLTTEFSGIMLNFHQLLPCHICRVEYQPMAKIVGWKIASSVDAAYVIWELHDTISVKLRHTNRLSFVETCALYSQNADGRRMTPQFTFNEYSRLLFE